MEQARQELAPRQVAGGAEQHHHVRAERRDQRRVDVGRIRTHRVEPPRRCVEHACTEPVRVGWASSRWMNTQATRAGRPFTGFRIVGHQCGRWTSGARARSPRHGQRVRFEVHLGRRAVVGKVMLGQTARGRMGKVVDDLDVARHLERGELFRDERVELVHVDGPAGSGDDERLHVFFRQVRRHADHRGFGDVGMAFERRLDLGRRQVLAPAAQHLLLASDERVGVVGVGGDQVAGAQPAVVHDRRGLVRHLVVAAHDHRVAQLQLAGAAEVDLRRRRHRARARRSRDRAAGVDGPTRASRTGACRVSRSIRRVTRRAHTRTRSRYRTALPSARDAPAPATGRCNSDAAGCRRRRSARAGASGSRASLRSS